MTDYPPALADRLHAARQQRRDAQNAFHADHRLTTYRTVVDADQALADCYSDLHTEAFNTDQVAAAGFLDASVCLERLAAEGRQWLADQGGEQP